MHRRFTGFEAWLGTDESHPVHVLHVQPKGATVYVVFSEKDVVIHETTTGDTTWRLASDCEDDDIFMAVWRKPTYPEGQWVIYWRGLWDKVRDRYEEVVLDMHLEEVGLWEGMPKGQDEALARAGAV